MMLRRVTLAQRSIVAAIVATTACSQKGPPIVLTPFSSMVSDIHAVTVTPRVPADSLADPSLGARMSDNLYIIDGTSIKVANLTSGSIVREFGAPGDDVGGFRQPNALVALDSGRVAILDRRRFVISIRDSLGNTLSEVPTGSGLFNSILPGETGRTFLLLGKRPVKRGAQSMDVHEFDLAGRHVGSYVNTPSSKSIWAVRFGAAFGTRVGSSIAVGSLASNEVRLYNLQTRALSSIRIAASWYHTPDWPASNEGASNTILAQQSNTWLHQQTLMDGIYPLSGGRMLVTFRDFKDPGFGSYYFAVADTAGRTISVSERTSVHLLDVRGDTAYWVARDPARGTVLGRGVIAGPRPTQQSH